MEKNKYLASGYTANLSMESGTDFFEASLELIACMISLRQDSGFGS
jgi:hypothetical protein